MENKKGKITKTSILLIVLVILAISVCSSRVYAWFVNSPTSTASISGGTVMSFYFSVNGEFNGNMVIEESKDNTVTDNTFVYLNENINGMAPGQTIHAQLTLSNKDSSVGANYQIKIKDMMTQKSEGSNGQEVVEVIENYYPKDCLLSVKLKGAENNLIDNKLLSSVDVFYPVADSADADANGFATIAAGAELQLEIFIAWPLAYDENIHTDIFDDEFAKNTADMEFMRDSNENNKKFRVLFEVNAEQVA